MYKKEVDDSNMVKIYFEMTCFDWQHVKESQEFLQFVKFLDDAEKLKKFIEKFGVPKKIYIDNASNQCQVRKS